MLTGSRYLGAEITDFIMWFGFSKGIETFKNGKAMFLQNLPGSLFDFLKTTKWLILNTFQKFSQLFCRCRADVQIYMVFTRRNFGKRRCISFVYAIRFWNQSAFPMWLADTMPSLPALLEACSLTLLPYAIPFFSFRFPRYFPVFSFSPSLLQYWSPSAPSLMSSPILA